MLGAEKYQLAAPSIRSERLSDGRELMPVGMWLSMMVWLIEERVHTSARVEMAALKK